MPQRNSYAFARALPIAGGLLFVGVALPTAAASNEYFLEYLRRSDTISVAPGNATDTNKAVQSITRWPQASREDRWLSDGEVARRAIARYRANRVTPPRTLSSQGENSVPQAADAPADAPAKEE